VFPLPRQPLGAEGLERAARAAWLVLAEAPAHRRQELPGVVEVALVQEVLAAAHPAQRRVGGQRVVDADDARGRRRAALRAPDGLGRLEGEANLGIGGGHGEP